MKIAIIGDMHLGAFQTDERAEDSFVQANEAIELAIKEKADLIVITGDIFDNRVPTQDILAKAMRIFRKLNETHAKNARIEKIIGKDESEIPRKALAGIPIIAIHGNHERRGKGLTNPVELLEKAGLLIYLNVATLLINIKNEKVAIHGMSYIPEKYAKEVLEKFNPKPIDNAINLFVFHQAVGQYVYTDVEQPTLMLEDLPAGFDLVVDGHVHWADSYKKSGLNFMLAGSTVSTQMRKIESERPKSIFIFESGKLKSIKLETQRPLFYETLSFDQIEPADLHKKIAEKVDGLLSGFKSEKKPLIRIVLRGILKKGIDASDLNLHKIEEEYGKKCILHIGREKVLAKEAFETRELLEQLLGTQISIEERGLQILQKNLAGTGAGEFEKTESLLNSLIEGSPDSAYKWLKENFKGVK